MQISISDNFEDILVQQNLIKAIGNEKDNFDEYYLNIGIMYRLKE